MQTKVQMNLGPVAAIQLGTRVTLLVASGRSPRVQRRAQALARVAASVESSSAEYSICGRAKAVGRSRYHAQARLDDLTPQWSDATQSSLLLVRLPLVRLESLVSSLWDHRQRALTSEDHLRALHLMRPHVRLRLRSER